MKIQEERVLLLMEENGITQRKMAQDLAISPTTLNGYLHGKYLHVPDDVIREIADYLQVSVDYITDRSALLQIGNGIHDKEEAVVIDNYRHLRPSDKKSQPTLSSSCLKIIVRIPANHDHVYWFSSAVRIMTVLGGTFNDFL